MTNKIDLKSFSADEIHHFIKDLGLPKYRAEQLMQWIYQKFALSVDDITVFSKELRGILNDLAFISNLKIVKDIESYDGTEKFLFSLEDSRTIESVLIPDKDRLTLCISSQVGCALGCRFCRTGKIGFIRNLKAFEIVDQIIAVNRLLSQRAVPSRITNIVLMGMGEPLLNFDEVTEALWRIVGFTGISKRKITLSTAGIVPKMVLLAEKAPGVNLAVSLNAADDETRDRIMPVNKKYPIKALLNACRKFPLAPGRRTTFEYVLIDGVNDSAEDARRLAGLIRGLRCKINLIPLNPSEGSSLKRPSDEKVREFQQILIQNNLTVLIRESKGRDILAACGQLMGK
jgi:23S rRNA (adenine2503-C2)-methyltransferase